ncbi:hypothetical protein ARMA_2431 [Ardenticatena maritima]|uniref:Uncharacterized protein n=1 Tax=Ardenticatena maritima TaxID=872965 RepID=A0A0N0RFS2_9CHLR|nr:hypothetical protein ARMA_2431 [Ardenticatena maritima]
MGGIHGLKSPNPRKGIETDLKISHAYVHIGASLKSPNPRKRIETA